MLDQRSLASRAVPVTEPGRTYRNMEGRGLVGNTCSASGMGRYGICVAHVSTVVDAIVHRQRYPPSSLEGNFRILRNSRLVLRQPQSLDSNRTRALCPSNVERFYTNLSAIYTQHKYQPSIIWNIDESGVQADRNGHIRVFASRGTRNMQCVVSNEREHLTILSAISASGVSIPNYYIFKGKRASKTYIQLCEDGATIGMNKKGWMDSHLFVQWMDHFLNSLTQRGISHLHKGIC